MNAYVEMGLVRPTLLHNGQDLSRLGYHLVNFDLSCPVQGLVLQMQSMKILKGQKEIIL